MKQYAKMFLMKLDRKLSAEQFILSIFLILTFSLILLAGLYYILNIEHQQPKTLFSNGPVTIPPKTLRLDLDQPDDNSLTFTSSAVISGQTAPRLSVLIFKDTDNLVVESKADGSFSTVLNLDEGVNRITAVVFDGTGDFRSAKKTVYYSKEKI